MSGKIKLNLENLSDKINSMTDQIAVSKKGLADALCFNGITNVSDTETFARYAYLIRRLKSANAMILEFNITEEALTDYKRTIVLPMAFGVDGNRGLDLNVIAKTVIANDSKTYSLYDVSTMELEDRDEDHIIKDAYSNDIIDGNYIPSMDDVEQYLTEEQANEFIESANNLGISLMSTNDDGMFEPDSSATYSYTVDWGDGSGEFIYDHNNSYEDNIDAIYHTYRKPGTYDVNINGVFKRIITQGDDDEKVQLENGKVKDTDGVVIYNNYNYGMIKHLVEVIAWGNTMLSNMESAFRGCEKLTTIPMYDTTNSFSDVTNFSNTFRRCYKLASLPFNENTNKGIFSGCEKVTTFAGCFSECTSLSGNIPPKLIDGCPNVTSVAEMFYGCTGITGKIPVDMIAGLTKLTSANSMFANCRGINDELTPGLFATCPNISTISGMYQGCTELHGNIPNGMFTGITTLTNVSSLFAGCTGIDGEIPNDLFEDCVNITTIAEIFSGCTKITGVIKKGAFSNLSKLTSMQRAFRNCSSITGFESGAFENLSANGLNCFEAFENCKAIESIPDNLINGISGLNVRLDRMFPNCTGITSIGINNLSTLKVADARGMFGGCTSLSTIADFGEGGSNFNTDWSSDEFIQRWYGAFANTAIGMAEETLVSAELGGFGARKTNSSVGKIATLKKDEQDKYSYELIEVKNFKYNENTPPIGIVYADVYLDPSKSVPTIANGQGNVVSKDTAGAKHKLFITVFNDIIKAWTNGQVNAEDITTITNTSDVNVAYSRYNWTDENVSTLNPTRYNGEAYTQAINDWRVNKGMAELVDGVYTKHDNDKYDAVEYVMSYNGIEGTNVQKLDEYKPFLPDAADLWDQFVMKYFIQKIINYVIAGGNGYTASNCASMRDEANYWASAEGSQTFAWSCSTLNTYVHYYYNKWVSRYVRPSLALDVAQA